MRSDPFQSTPSTDHTTRHKAETEAEQAETATEHGGTVERLASSGIDAGAQADSGGLRNITSATTITNKIRYYCGQVTSAVAGRG